MLVIELGDPGRKLRMVNHAISLARADFDVQAKTHFSAHIMTLFFLVIVIRYNVYEKNSTQELG